MVSLDGMDFNIDHYGGNFDLDNFCGDMDYGMPEDRYPQHFICEGPVPGITQYCIQDNKIYEGCMPGGNCVACIDQWGRVHKGYFETNEVIANIGEDGRIYEGIFPGTCIGSIIDGRVTLDGNYFPTTSADFNIF